MKLHFRITEQGPQPVARSGVNRKMLDIADAIALSSAVYVPEYKPLTTTYVPAKHDTFAHVSMPVVGMRHYHCLAAGTPIWPRLTSCTLFGTL